jgi:hypothetical protein
MEEDLGLMALTQEVRTSGLELLDSNTIGIYFDKKIEK